jgi:hypothetical protein
MNTSNIEIIGITPQSEFPACPPHHPCTQICQTDKLFLSCEHEIKKILKVIVTVSICSFKIIHTPVGKKVVVQGIKHIKVISSIEKECNCTQTACFDIPFCLFIMLKDFDVEITKICTIVEDVSVQCLKHQFLLVSIIIFACPIFKNENKHCPHDNHNIHHNHECKKTCNCNEIPHDFCNCQNQHECNETCNCHNDNQIHHSTCPVCHRSSTARRYATSY